MDNDIATVAEGALDVVKDLKQLDLTGKVKKCHKNNFDNSLALLNLDEFCHKCE